MSTTQTIRSRQPVIAKHRHDHRDHHDHHHHHASSPEELSTRIVQLGLVTNLALAAVKLLGGFVFKSKSLTADGWHSMTDLVTDVLALAALLATSLLKSTNVQNSTVGHVERGMSLLASGMLVVLGVHMGWESGSALRSQLFGQSEMVDSLEEAPSMQAVWVALLTIAVKEWLYHTTMKVAAESKSSVLASNAMHQRADSLMSMVTVAAILASNVLSDTAWIDSVGGLCISAIVVHAALGNLGNTLS